MKTQLNDDKYFDVGMCILQKDVGQIAIHSFQLLLSTYHHCNHLHSRCAFSFYIHKTQNELTQCIIHYFSFRLSIGNHRSSIMFPLIGIYPICKSYIIITNEANALNFAQMKVYWRQQKPRIGGLNYKISKMIFQSNFLRDG
jgi:hypothetical protein